MTENDKKMLREIGDVCRACCEHGLGWQNSDVLCATCPVGHLYDILVGNEKEE